MPIHDLCFKNVVTVSKETSLTQAAKKMENDHVGALVVTNENRKAIGILTDRDIVLAGVAAGKPMTTKVSDIMTKDVLHVPRSSGVAEVIEKMLKREVRRVLVVDETDEPCGLISSDDLLQLLGNELNNLSNLVSRQLNKEGLAKAV